MHQDANNREDQQHILDRITIPALPPAFTHRVIEKQYQAGQYSRLEAEITDILQLFQPPQVQGGEEAMPLILTDEALTILKHFNCIALIQEGQVLPLLDIEHLPTPVTAAQRIHLYHTVTRTLLDAIAAILEDQAESRKHQTQQDDDTEGDSCYAG